MQNWVPAAAHETRAQQPAPSFAWSQCTWLVDWNIFPQLLVLLLLG
jgi:hypothetical protein